MEQKEIIKSLEDQLKRKVISYEEVEDNNYFIELLNKVDEFIAVHNLSENLEKQLSGRSFQIISIVDLKKGSKAKFHNCITLALADESLIRFSSCGIDGLELTRILVKGENQKKGQGTYLMKVFMKFIKDSIGFIPTIFLECTGEIGIDKNAQSMDISAQTKFFRKFGFRVKDRSQYPNYVNMFREKSLG
jgi:hypothetical protein